MSQTYTVTQTQLAEGVEQMEIDNPGQQRSTAPGSFSSSGRDSGIETDSSITRRPMGSPLMRRRSRPGSSGDPDGLQRRSGDFTITATVRSPVLNRRGLPGGYTQASVTTVANDAIKPEDPASASLVRPVSGGSNDAIIRSGHNQQPGRNDEEVIGTATISAGVDPGPVIKQEPTQPKPTIPEQPSNCRPSCIPQIPIACKPDPHPPTAQTFQIFVKNLDGRTSTYLVSRKTKVEELRVMIRDNVGVPPAQQVLQFAGRNLQDGHILGEYNVEPESTIHLTGRLRGG